MLPSSTIQHLQSVPNGLVWKHSSSLLTTHSSSSTVTSSYVTQPSQAPSALRNVFKVAVEGVTQVLRWLMMCTLWSRAPSTSNERNESKRSAVLWIKTVSDSCTVNYWVLFVVFLNGKCIAMYWNFSLFYLYIVIYELLFQKLLYLWYGFNLTHFHRT